MVENWQLRYNAVWVMTDCQTKKKKTLIFQNSTFLYLDIECKDLLHALPLPSFSAQRIQRIFQMVNKYIWHLQHNTSYSKVVMASKSAARRLHEYISLQSVSIVWQCLAQTVTSYAQLGCSDAAALFRFGGFLPLFIALLLARQHQTLNQKNPPLNLPSNSQLE